jgi:hypothetical protein
LPSVFQPRLDLLPSAQRRLWPELAGTPPEFTLYGGTAIALRLGHRPSIDFDWFATESFAPNDLIERVPYLKGAAVRQSSPNTLTATVDRDEPVQVSFFGGLDLGQVAEADIAAGPEIKVGSLFDLAGFKAAVVMRRAELRDYIDVHALMTKANISLAEMLAAALIIYGDQFSPLLSLKALAYHDDAALRELPANVRRDLTAAVAATDPRRLPVLHAVRTKAASR